MASNPRIAERTAIIDRDRVAARLEDGASPGLPCRQHAVSVLRPALAKGRAELKRRLEAEPGSGRALAQAHARLVDELIDLLYGFVATRLHPRPSATTGERLAVIAVGGYGRGELAPFSDIDLLFLTPNRAAPWTEQVSEAMLYVLWDLGFKVGHSVRSVAECVRTAKVDVTIRTAMLEGRLVAGDTELDAEAVEAFRREVVQGSGARFVADKLAERNARHKAMGNSRYVVEPNLKEGKGGLRDLHTLFWIGKYLHKVESVDDLVRVGLLTGPELRQFRRAESFFWAVRWQLHDIRGRADERLTFDVQPELARRLRYADRPGSLGVERFMRHYFLHARHVGSLTGVFLTLLEESFGSRGWFRRIIRRPRQIGAFTLKNGRLSAPSDDVFRADPVRLIDLFARADQSALDIDAGTLRLAARDSVLIDEAVRADPRAADAFLSVLTSPRDPEDRLRQMNEAGVFGRFLPDFGRIVAKPQFDMYHHYTVDEHTIRALGLLSRIESGALSSDYPLASRIAHQVSSRRVLYLAVLLHDIAKGRNRDHSIVGAEIALRLCPRLGLSEAETETVAWLVRWHLLLAATAFKRDLSDPKTVADFAAAVGSLERLRLLLVLTTVDISAVGPGTWTPWKGQLMGDLYERAEELLRLGHRARGRSEEIAAKQARLGTALGWDAAALAAYAYQLPDSYWIAESEDAVEANARLVTGAAAGGPRSALTVDAATGTTLVSACLPDQPGLFSRLAGAIALAGASIVDARIHTTRDGRALDNFVVQSERGGAFDEARQLARLNELVEGAMDGTLEIEGALAGRTPPARRAEVFARAPAIYVSNKLSNRFTVVEVGVRDRPGLLFALTDAIHRFGAVVRSAHIATYGERANDTFYLTGLNGLKITDASELDALERALYRAAAPASPMQAAA